ncbi:MAG: cellulase family glycosylhydrolase [Deltaproteobacteria bacterium]|nr:cellulase family glycosylhydrolase [Deltaproteobacteria bacterium]
MASHPLRVGSGFGLGAVCALAACAGAPARSPETPAAHGGDPVGASAAPSSPASERHGAGDFTEGAGDDRRDPSRAARALVFRAAGFPTVDAPAIDEATLDAALAGLPVERAGSAEELEKKLVLRDVDVLILPYGSAFPVDAWPRIRGFLKRGGGLAVLGGAPFHEPVRMDAKTRAWTRGPRQSAFAHDLLIGPAETLASPARGKTVFASTPEADSGWTTAFPDAARTWALTLRLSTNKDMPDEHGSAGPRDAVARPLVHVVDASGTPRGCPLLEIDQHRGDAAGGRWVLATSDAKLDPPVIRAIVTRALEGSSELRAQPVRAAIDPGEHAHVRVTQRRFVLHGKDRDAVASTARVTVKDSRGKEIFASDVALSGMPESRTAVVPIRAALTPGLYHVVVEGRDTRSPRVARSGFVVRDERLMASAPKVSVTRDWLRKDGKAFPVVGTTYMASDVHRKFLFEPNPHVWDADFAAMERRGINFVRTGLWTAWSRAMLDPGAIDETVIAALDAFVQSAARHGIVVCFNLFAFLPPAYTGDNPYLDPRAIEGQRELLTMLASHFKGSAWVHWDLINEPSYAPRSALWSTRAIGDEHEMRAWHAWLVKKHGDDTRVLRALFHDPDMPMRVPRPEDFTQAFVQVSRRPRKVRAFQEFAQDVVTSWAGKMREILHTAGGRPLVTLGQDEGGIYERPTQQIMAESLDYTAVHTWWKNDDLLWDGVTTKVPEKPSLHQETGLMRLEDVDGTPWRTPEAAARLLERKVAYAFAGRGTGVVEWAWNVNPYMPIDEESTIGLFRPDGTAKPELDPLVDAAAFFRVAAPHLDDFERDTVVMVVPHARAFLGRTNGIDATKIVVRALAERFGVVPTGISDLRLTAKRLEGVKLVVVPGADVLDEPAAKALLEASKAGTKVLFTGPIEGDSYGRDGDATPSLKALGVLGPRRPVAMHEKSAWSASGWVSFDGLLQESLGRADKPSVASLSTGGTGSAWHEPLPLELARDREPLVRLLDAALSAAQVPTSPGEWGVAARALLAPRAILLTVINERPEATIRKVKADGRTFEIPVGALGARLVLVERGTGRTIAATPGDAVR